MRAEDVVKRRHDEDLSRWACLAQRLEATYQQRQDMIGINIVNTAWFMISAWQEGVSRRNPQIVGVQEWPKDNENLRPFLHCKSKEAFERCVVEANT